MANLLDGRPLHDRVAVVTGASSGIGEATAERLAELGAAVALLARRTDRLEAVAKRITSAGGVALVLPTDVTEPDAVQAAADAVAAELGPADLVFANAGIQLISSITDARIDEWNTQIDTNIKGVMYTARAFLGQLEQAAERGEPADFIITSSIAATRELPKFSVYSGTKAYLSHLARLLRIELGPKMIRVAVVEPGMVDTELPDHVTDPDASKLMEDLIEQIDVLSGRDVAETTAFIAASPRHVNLTEVTILPTAQAV